MNGFVSQGKIKNKPSFNEMRQDVKFSQRFGS